MSIQNEQRRERRRLQAAHRRELNAAAKARRATTIAPAGTQDTRDQVEVGRWESEADGRPDAPANEEIKIEMTETDPREALWAGYCRFVGNLHRRGELPSFQDDLRNGRCSDVEAPQLMNAAIEFVIERGGLRPSRWSPAPTDEQLGNLPSWIAQRLVEERVEREAVERRKRRQQGLARQLGKAVGEAPTGNGSRTSPVYQQTSKHDLAELARRLECTMARHEAERGKFERAWLDSGSPYYIHDSDGGISTKGIVFMANAIVGRQEHRDYNENWSIVMNWLREQQASRSKSEQESAS